MEGRKQHIQYPTQEHWTEEQEKEYWHDVNKSHDERFVLNNLKKEGAKGISVEVPTEKGEDDSDIYKDLM